MKTWQDVVLALIAALPAVIAAVSSLRNGREQKRVKDELAVTNGHLRKVTRKIGRH